MNVIVPLIAISSALSLALYMRAGRLSAAVSVVVVGGLAWWILGDALDALLCAIGVTAGSFLGARLVARYCASPNPFSSARSVLSFALLGGLVGPLVVLILASPALCSECGLWQDFVIESLLPAGLMLSAVVVTVTPAVVTWSVMGWNAMRSRLTGETGLVLVAATLVGIATLPTAGVPFPASLADTVRVAILFWAVARLGVPGIAATVAVLVGIETAGAVIAAPVGPSGPAFVGADWARLAEQTVVSTAVITLGASLEQLSLAARHLAISEERYRSLVETIREVVLGMEPSGRMVFANSAWTQLTGYSPRETLGRQWLEFVHSEDALLVPDASVDRLSEGGPSWTEQLDGREIRLRHSDGSAIWVQIHLTANENDSPPILGTLRDVTGERLAAARREEHVAARTAELSQAYAQQRLLNRLLRIDASSVGESAVLSEALEVVCSSRTLWRSTRGCIFLARGDQLELAAGNVDDAMAASLRANGRRAFEAKLVEHMLVGEEASARSEFEIVLGDAGAPFGVMALHVNPPRARSAAEIRFHESLGRQVATLIRQCRAHAAILQEQQRRTRLLSSNQQLTRRILDLQETERQNLARELHDELGQWLVAIQVEAEHLVGPQHADRDVADSARAIRDATSRVYDVTHAIMTRLRPPLLDELGLASSLSDLVERRTTRTAPVVTLDLVGDLSGVPAPLDIHLYRIVQEGITNAWRHAQARTVSVRLETTGKGAARYVQLHLRDDGRGFELSDAPEGFGLAGMRERASAVGGQLDIESAQGAGTSIRGHFPWIPRSADA